MTESPRSRSGASGLGEAGVLDIIVVDATGTKTREASVPGKVASGRIVAQLVEQMELPSVGPDGHPLTYTFMHKKCGRQINDHKTLEDAGVKDGDVLRLLPEIVCGVQGVTPPVCGLQGMTPPDYEQRRHNQMDITVVDATGSKTEEATVPGNAAAGRIMAKLIELMELPSVGPDGHPLAYKFLHKQSGRQINDDETLEDAGVKDGDVLRLVAEIVAG